MRSTRGGSSDRPLNPSAKMRMFKSIAPPASKVLAPARDRSAVAGPREILPFSRRRPLRALAAAARSHSVLRLRLPGRHRDAVPPAHSMLHRAADQVHVLAGHLSMWQASFVESLGEASDNLRGDAFRHPAHDGRDGRFRMRLVEPPQTLGRFSVVSKMATESQLKAKSGQTTIFMQRFLGPRQSRFVPPRRQMRKGHCLDEVKAVRVARTQLQSLLGRGDRLIRSVEENQNQRPTCFTSTACPL